MSPIFEIGLRACWLAIAVYFFLAYRRNKIPEQTEPLFKRLIAYWLPFSVALVLGPGDWFIDNLFWQPFVPHTTFVYSIGLCICIFGTLLAIWSRSLLGRNWSATVQLKQEHELISSGPYRFVRHPLYTGLLILFFGSAVMIGDLRGLLAVAIMLISLWFKLKLEEKWLLQHFGDRYSAYQRRTKMLLPGLL